MKKLILAAAILSAFSLQPSAFAQTPVAPLRVNPNTGAVVDQANFASGNNLPTLNGNNTFTGNITLNGTTTFGNATQARGALGLGTLATQNGTFSGTSSGNNTGDQTLVGLGGLASTNGTATNLTVNGTLTANGSALTSLNGTQITTGTLAAARLPNLTLNLSGTLHNTPVTFTAGVGNATLADQTVNTVLAGPSSGNSTTPTFRALTSSDLPTITLNLSGTLHNTPVTFTAGVGNATLANQTVNTVLAGPSSGNSTAPIFRALVNSDIPSSLALSGNLSNNGTFTAGDAAADEFSATDDDPRFPNLTAATYTAAADNKVAINGDVGDARYGGPTYLLVLASDEQYSTTNATNSSLSATLPAGTYKLEALLAFTTNSTTAGVNAFFATGTGDKSVSITTVFVNGGSTLTPRGNYMPSGAQNVIGISVDAPMSNVSTTMCRSESVFTLSSQRTITLTVSQRTAADGSNPIVFRAPSWIFIRKIQ